MGDNNGKRMLKIIILGANKSGKTALTVRFLTGKFIFEYASGHDIVYKHNFQVSSTEVPLQIVDTSCNENITDALNGADGMVVVYAIDNEKSFDKAKEILSDVKHRDVNNNKEPCVALVANKSDLWPYKSVERSDGKELAERYQCRYFEMSALSGKDGVFDMFNSVIHLAVEKVRVRSLSLPAFPYSPMVLHEEIKRASSSPIFNKKDEKQKNLRSFSVSAACRSVTSITPSESIRQNNTNNRKISTKSLNYEFGRSKKKSESGKLSLDRKQSNSNISKLLQKTLGDIGNIPTDNTQREKNNKLVHKTLSDMGQIAFSAIAFPMMGARELKT